MTEPAVLHKLEDLERKEGPLPELLQLHRRLLQIQAGVREKMDEPHPGLTGEAASGRLKQGKPLLQPEEFTFDWTLFLDAFTRVVGLFSEFSQVFGLTPEDFRAPPPDQVVSRDTIAAWLEGRELPQTQSLSQALIKDLVHAAVKPFLVSYSRALAPLVDQMAWRRRYCPVCGGSADFSCLETERGARWLLCSRCDAEWLFQRLECPYCGSRKPDDLSYYSDDAGMYRIYVCDRCRHYLKAVDLRVAGKGITMAAERLLTLGLDAQAREKGYLPAT